MQWKVFTLSAKIYYGSQRDTQTNVTEYQIRRYHVCCNLGPERVCVCVCDKWQKFNNVVIPVFYVLLLIVFQVHRNFLKTTYLVTGNHIVVFDETELYYRLILTNSKGYCVNWTFKNRLKFSNRNKIVKKKTLAKPETSVPTEKFVTTKV